jgi:hypothetical protein
MRLERPWAFAASEGFWQTGLAQDAIRGVPADNADRHGKAPFGDRAVPDVMAAFTGADEVATRTPQQPAQLTIECDGHNMPVLLKVLAHLAA